MKKYLAAFIVLVVALAALIIFLNRTAIPAEANMRWQMLIYFSVVTLAFHYGLEKTKTSRPQVFVRYYMGATTFKLLLHLGVILVYSLFHREIATRFIITFMVMYFIFTIFEIALTFRSFPRKS